MSFGGRRFPSAAPGHRKPAARGPGSRSGFGATWWGKAWVQALEQRARLDPNRLPRGRGYARSGAVGELVVSAGEVRAAVQGTRRTPYNVRVRVRVFSANDWDRVLDAVAAQLGHTAALLDGELPPAVVDDVRGAGLDLLPGAGEVGPSCSCPDFVDPCKHAAAVCYLVAGELDRDPFALLLLRGRSREEVLAGLRARRRSGSEAGPPEQVAVDDAGVPAQEAWAAGSDRPALPGPMMPPARPGQPAVLAVDPPAGAPFSRQGLHDLAADAAARAWELASGVGDGGLGAGTEADLARRARGLLGTPQFAALAARAGMPATELARWALAWRAGGAGGLVALRERWSPSPEAVAEGRAAFTAAGIAVHARSNRLTGGGLQLRLGRDGLWYRFHRRFGDWDPDGSPDPDPGRLLDS